MSIRLLETKLYVPRLRQGLVPRPRLGERLDRGTASRLTLVYGPAGFGKTTLLSEWLATDERPAAWLSLDRGDNDPASFWAHVVAALQSVSPEVGTMTLALLQESRPPPIEHVLTPLLNEVGAVASDIVLALDDYHVIDAREVPQIMALALLTGLYFAFGRRTGTFGLVAFLVNGFALASLVGVEFVINLVFSELPASTRDALLAGPLGIALTVASIAFLLGTLAFVTAMLRTHELPTVPLALYAVGAVPISLRAFVPEVALDLGLVVLAAGIAWLAIWLFDRANRITTWSAVNPPRTSSWQDVHASGLGSAS